MQKVLARCLNRNQLLILRQVGKGNCPTITATIRQLAKESSVSISTLKLNASILQELNLIIFSNYSAVQLTDCGHLVLDILEGGHEL
ncbi:MAG: hypothetical protein HY519_02340 [Candidatus Aenigmarchaeota archaeon]|nr:hypothetical protein [Candidatus Aenigmarchaeota archaeon]